MSRILWLVLASVLFSLVITSIMYMEDTVDIEQKTETAYVPKVSIVSVSAQTQTGAIRTVAEIKPRWAVTLKAHVGGEVIRVSDKAMAGQRIHKGDMLVQLENSVYAARLAEAQKSLADAQLVLLQERRKSKLVLNDLARSGLNTELTDLAKNVPQLEVARKAIDVAKKNIAAAEKEIAYTKITAPFTGVVTQRFVSIGQTVNSGDDLVHVLDQDYLDIAVSLSPHQWVNLADDWQGRSTEIKNDRGHVIAQATIKRGGGFLDPATRQYKVFLEIQKDKNTSALAGEFVHLELPGKVIPQTLRIPESAYTREGTVWYVDADDRLRYFESDILFYLSEQLIVSRPKDSDKKSYRIITTPLASFVAGKEVLPVEVEEL